MTHRLSSMARRRNDHEMLSSADRTSSASIVTVAPVGDHWANRDEDAVLTHRVTIIAEGL